MTESYGVSHLHYQMGVIPEWSMLLFFKVLLLGLLWFDWLGIQPFDRLLKARYAQWIPHPVWRNTIGGAVVVAAALICKHNVTLG